MDKSLLFKILNNKPLRMLIGKYINASKKEVRRYRLTKAMAAVGLRIRSDSRLCAQYIDGTLGEEWTIDEIVQEMAKLRYYFKFCGLRSTIKKIKKERDDKINEKRDWNFMYGSRWSYEPRDHHYEFSDSDNDNDSDDSDDYYFKEDSDEMLE
ncbi:hypothetical protein PPL_02126 [Heterostelium album PN500]|uniref:Uncharacterized protein n=1 Tax=Heterostelium pallidum (strain ATCC 26659 / Pp 5 / PN500) TaxID=670386 RepID=D3B1F4_HETP5|nr:hypothetical protein PPL_02126 [Heterostelium album PN500]EFA85128.1 hypothetical protein PPL_02126 [Heterostelium album PN500]|eukprot:XP_020437237.1 hypothetical protein PPL_02126 [Heterostelium album PN500]